MGRAPCCDKATVKRGPWSPEEDAMLKDYIEKHGTGGNWIALPQNAGLRRCGKSCRLRWLNYLRPNIKHGDFTDFEDRVICTLYASIGSRWSVIAAQLPGRTDNDIKNYWNTKLKKKLMALLPAMISQSQRTTSLVSPLQFASSFLFSPLPHHIPSPPLPSIPSPSCSLPLALQSSPSTHEISFENPMQHYQLQKDGSSSIAYGGSSGDGTCSSSEANYNFSSTSSTVGGTSSDQSVSYDFYPYQEVEEKENLVPASSGGGGSGCTFGGSGWSQQVATDKAWGENAVTADYGFEEIKQLISTNISTTSCFLFDENKVGESVYY